MTDADDRIQQIMAMPLAKQMPALAEHLAYHSNLSIDDCMATMQAAKVSHDEIAARQEIERLAAIGLRQERADMVGTVQ